MQPVPQSTTLWGMTHRHPVPLPLPAYGDPPKKRTRTVPTSLRFTPESLAMMDRLAAEVGALQPAQGIPSRTGILLYALDHLERSLRQRANEIWDMGRALEPAPAPSFADRLVLSGRVRIPSKGDILERVDAGPKSGRLYRVLQVDEGGVPHVCRISRKSGRPTEGGIVLPAEWTMRHLVDRSAFPGAPAAAPNPEPFRAEGDI